MTNSLVGVYIGMSFAGAGRPLEAYGEVLRNLRQNTDEGIRLGQSTKWRYLSQRETINGLYKAALVHRRTLWNVKESLELAMLGWGSWFNHHGLLKSIGYIPPAEA